jgi:predicted XRE-type DNA-binding protein
VNWHREYEGCYCTDRLAGIQLEVAYQATTDEFFMRSQLIRHGDRWLLKARSMEAAKAEALGILQEKIQHLAEAWLVEVSA